MKHDNGVELCPRCEVFLGEAHPVMVEWYRGVKKAYPQAHISCAWRGKEDQERAVLEGKSRAHWPDSKHNKVYPSGAPAAEALDLFRLSPDGRAHWPPLWFADIAEWSEDEPILWGGRFKAFRDTPHFELSLAKSEGAPS